MGWAFDHAVDAALRLPAADYDGKEASHNTPQAKAGSSDSQEAVPTIIRKALGGSRKAISCNEEWCICHVEWCLTSISACGKPEEEIDRAYIGTPTYGLSELWWKESWQPPANPAGWRLTKRAIPGLAAAASSAR